MTKLKFLHPPGASQDECPTYPSHDIWIWSENFSNFFFTIFFSTIPPKFGWILHSRLSSWQPYKKNFTLIWLKKIHIRARYVFKLSAKMKKVPLNGCATRGWELCNTQSQNFSIGPCHDAEHKTWMSTRLTVSLALTWPLIFGITRV